MTGGKLVLKVKIKTVCYCLIFQNGPISASPFSFHQISFRKIVGLGRLKAHCTCSWISLRRTHHKAYTLYKADKDFTPIFQFSGQTLSKVISIKQAFPSSGHYFMFPMVSNLERFHCMSIVIR